MERGALAGERTGERLPSFVVGFLFVRAADTKKRGPQTIAIPAFSECGEDDRS